jgi:hypothetical protein
MPAAQPETVAVDEVDLDALSTEDLGGLMEDPVEAGAKN